MEVYDGAVIADIPVFQEQICEICAPFLVGFLSSEVLFQLVFKYFVGLPGLCSWGGRWSAGPTPCSYIYGQLCGCSGIPCVPDKLSCCGNRPHRYGCGRYPGSAPELLLFGYNNPPSGVSGSYNKHSGRFPATSAASGFRILYGAVQ